MNILEKITQQKRLEVQQRKINFPVAGLEKSSLFRRNVLSFDTFLDMPERTGIIAEFKRKSPSRGVLNAEAEAGTVTKGYAENGASALSVLTETAFFSGSDADFSAARKATEIPMLRKDFILEEYQILEARALGADVILLIAAILSPAEIQSLSKFAAGLGLQVLLEVHSRKELEGSLGQYINVVGVNNRNLEDFSVSVDTSFELGALIPSEFKKISESAISDPKVIKKLKAAGFSGFLIGETFMKERDPVEAFKKFVKQVREE